MTRGSGPGRRRWPGAAGAALAALISAQGTRAQQAPRFGEHVSVSRLVIDARVLDDRGEPVLGLTAADFRVRVGGRPARVESATWIGQREPDAVRAASLPRAGDGAGPEEGRLIVFLFQKDLEPSRIVGLMRMLVKSRDLLGTLTANDRIAILSFDSHLRVWCDFTSDRERLERVLAHGVLFETPPPVQTSREPSLVERLDPETARHAGDIEQALDAIGQALERLPGSKSLVLVGHGFGRFTGAGVLMVPDYGRAREALLRSRTSVFSLDVTDADYHSLEAGLQIVAEDTGGFYARTHLFPGQAMRRLAGALAGYYVLFVERPEGGPTSRDLSVRVTRVSGRVLASRRYAGRVE